MAESNVRLPQLSVILVTTDCYATIRETALRLAAQSARDRLELIIVAPTDTDLGLVESDLDHFQSVRLVRVDEIRSLGSAKVAGLPFVHAPVVAFGEDHAYPDPGWAEALIAAHEEPWAAVGPAILNANPGSSLSWANLFISFGPWVERTTSGRVRGLPWHNTSYKLNLLLDYGPALEDMLNVEGIMQADLNAKGRQFYLEVSAKISHVNITRVPSFVREQFHSGRWFAARRAQYGRWSLGKRLLYVIGSPVLPVLRLWRTSRDIRRTGKQKLFLGMLPWLSLGLVLHSAGEAVGYILGVGNSPHGKFELEHHRTRHISKALSGIHE